MAVVLPTDCMKCAAHSVCGMARCSLYCPISIYSNGGPERDTFDHLDNSNGGPERDTFDHLDNSTSASVWRDNVKFSTKITVFGAVGAQKLRFNGLNGS